MAEPIRVYVDNCIISGIVRPQLSAEERRAMARIALAHQARVLKLFTSEVTAEEIAQIPTDDYRAPHNIVYGLLSAVSSTVTVQRLPPFTPAPMFRREDIRYTRLR